MARAEPAIISVDANEKPLAPYTWLLFFIGHSGSSAFTQQLGWHPNVKLIGYEPLTHLNSSAALSFTTKVMDEARLENLAGKRVSVGFKLREWSIGLSEYGQWSELIRRHGTRVMLQTDENILRSVTGDLTNRHALCAVCEGKNLSNVASAQHHCQHCMAEGNPSALQFLVRNKLITTEDTTRIFPVYISISQILINAFHEVLRQRGMTDHVNEIMGRLSSTLHLTYHDFMIDSWATITKALDWMGVENPYMQRVPPEGRVAFVRSSGALRWCDKIHNWNRVCLAFGSCQKLGWMLADAENDGCTCEGRPRSCEAGAMKVEGIPPLHLWPWYNVSRRR